MSEPVNSGELEPWWWKECDGGRYEIHVGRYRLAENLTRGDALTLEKYHNRALKQLRPPVTQTTVLGFASWADGRFELIVRDDESHEETTLKGKLEAGQFEQINKILPTCVFVKANVRPPVSAAEIAECCDEPRGFVGAACDHCGGIVAPDSQQTLEKAAAQDGAAEEEK